METRLIVKGIFFSVLLAAAAALAGGKINVAVLDFEAKNISRENAEALTDLLRTELFNTGRFTVVERQKIQKILEEQKFQMSGLTDTDEVTQIGRLLNVKKIMIGTITKLGGTHIINTRIVDVQSGQVELAEAVESKGGEDLLPGAVTELALKISYKVGLEGSIIRITGETFYIDLGSADGIATGQVFSVIRPGEAITDLEGRVIGTNSEIIGSIMITKVQNRFSEAAMKKSSTAFRKGDKVRPGEEDIPKPAIKEIKKQPPKPKVKKEQTPSDQKQPDVPPTF
ncbi:MAG TPA: CsgG/HfaB family protein [bacterium]